MTEIDELGGRITDNLSPQYTKRVLSKFNKSILDTIVNGRGDEDSPLITKNTVFPALGGEA